MWKRKRTVQHRRRFLCRVAAAQACLLVAMMGAASGQSSTSSASAFLEPYKRIQIAATDIARLSSIEVMVGEQVSAGQVVARLDDSVLRASRATAVAAKDAVGNRRAADAELQVKTRQLQTLQELRTRGNATQREVERALADLELADARLQAVREDLEVKRCEYEKIVVQIEQRQLKSPINGVVTKIDKEAGEFVAPTDPNVMTVVQLNPLQATFSVSIGASRRIKSEDRVTVLVGTDLRPVQGIVEYKSPVAEPKSSTVRVNVLIQNPRGEFLSGSLCRWQIAGAAADADAGPVAARSARRPNVATQPAFRSAR